MNQEDTTIKRGAPRRPDLGDEGKDRIREVFSAEIVPKLARLHARRGTLCCVFAGEEYRNWVIHFQSSGSSFEITDFEYDEEAAGMDLDL